MIKLYVAQNEGEAVSLKSYLEAHGIRTVISSSSTNMSGIFGVSNGLVSYDVFVSEEDGGRRRKKYETFKKEIQLTYTT